MSVQEKLTALADQVRLLSGKMIRMGLDDMAEQTMEANVEVLQQGNLIRQIYLALQNVSGGSGSGMFTSGSNGELPVVFSGSASASFEICREAAACQVVD